MSLDQIVSLVSATISLIGLLIVAWQLREGRRQRESESLVEIFDINRELVSLGFSHPQLFDILEGKSADPVSERRYLQLWLNQLSLIHRYLKHAVFEPELQAWLEVEVTDFMMRPNVQGHWQTHGAFYPASFQAMVNRILKSAEPSTDAPVQAASTWRAIFSNVARDIRTKASPAGAVNSAPSAGAGIKPCTNTSPLSAKMAAGQADLAQSWGIAPFSPMIRVIFMRIRDSFRAPKLRILVHQWERRRMCLTAMAVVNI